MSRWPHGDPNAVVKEVLAQPAYRAKPTQPDSPVLRFWDEFWQWVDHVTSPFFHWLDRALSSGHGPAQVVTLAIVVVTVVALALLILRIVLAFTKPAAARRQVVGHSLDERLDAAAWQALAAERAARGDYARAIAALFAAALAMLDERALVPFNASRTPGEYRRLVRTESRTIAKPFDALTERFVRAAFAAQPVRREDCDAAFAAFGELRPLVEPA